MDLFTAQGASKWAEARDEQRSLGEIRADAFVDTNSLAPILPLAAGPSGYARVIGTSHQAVFERGLELARAGGLSLRGDELRTAFEKGFALT